MTLKFKHLIYIIFCALVVGLVIGSRVQEVHHEEAVRTAQQAQLKKKQQKAAAKKQQKHQKQPKQVTAKPANMRQPIDWRQSSETVAYPNLKTAKHLWIKVSLRGNRTYLFDGQKLIYTMYSTGGMYVTDKATGKKKSMTPTGTFHIQKKRGDSFYNAKLQEGARYYVSWKDNGKYLFHSVPTYKDGTFNTVEAGKLGKTQGSHGCIRLSVPDAQWLSKNVPVGTKVVITDN